MKLVIPEALLNRAIEALEYKAQMEAGQSQAPALFTREETQAWDDAKAVRQAIRNAKITQRSKLRS